MASFQHQTEPCQSVYAIVLRVRKLGFALGDVETVLKAFGTLNEQDFDTITNIFFSGYSTNALEDDSAPFTKENYYRARISALRFWKRFCMCETEVA